MHFSPYNTLRYVKIVLFKTTFMYVRGFRIFQTSRYHGIVKATLVGVFDDLKFKRSIFQTLWKPDFGARFLFIELDSSNFG